MSHTQEKVPGHLVDKAPHKTLQTSTCMNIPDINSSASVSAFSMIDCLMRVNVYPSQRLFENCHAL